MTLSGTIVVGEGWISEHYFTTDARSGSFQARVLARRKQWDEDAAEGNATPRTRFAEARGGLEVDLAKITERATSVDVDRASDAATIRAAAESIYDRVVTVLGLREHGLSVDDEGAISRISAPGITHHAPLVLVRANPVDSVEDVIAKDAPTLPEPVEIDGEPATSAARLLSALFHSDEPPDFILVLAGRWAVLAERERWDEGRYLAVDLQAICERNDLRRGAEVDRALTCLAAESIAPDADGAIWWHDVLEESIKHTVGVSQDLRDGVRLSIEIIANDVVARRAAQGLPPLPKDQAQPLARQSLRFLYRILFLLYAEASPQLGVLPVGATEYDQGYGLDRLRELVQVELATPPAQHGTHLYDSLATLFRLVDQGHRADAPAAADTREDTNDTAGGDTLTFNALRADLFRSEAIALIAETGLGNAAVQRVLAHLLLSKEKGGRDRGYISYAELGINQLGAVYEGLMSYTGFFAETDLYEVAPAGNAEKGSWVIDADRADDIEAKDFVRATDPITGEHRPILHNAGTFVFRLSGRDRQQSASYYTPEVLTKFTVGQALEELLDQDGTTTPAREILDITVCEPALGSGAFAIEAVRQLAEEYLNRREAEVGRKVDPDDRPRELQQIKAYLALHNVYGVDLNATAVELAEISMWLDTMSQGLDAPWFGLHLRRGNSLIGARRAVYARADVSDKSWLRSVPRDAPLSTLLFDVEHGFVGTGLAGDIHHFLLPAEGWGSAVDAKEAASLAPDAAKALKLWRAGVQRKPTRRQVDDLVELAHRVEVLWQYAYRRLQIAEAEIRRDIPVWGASELPVGGAVQREQIEAALADPDGAYRRLRRVMDAWCALWFWPLTEASVTVTVDGVARVQTPPDLDEWIAALQALLGRDPEVRKRKPEITAGLTGAVAWDELAEMEEVDLGLTGAKRVTDVARAHPWLQVCESVAEQQGFFHWELDFASVFARGGFDLQLGNPPWVRPDWDESAALAEYDPWWKLALKPTQQQVRTRHARTLAIAGARDLYVDTATTTSCMRAAVSSMTTYPYLQGLRPDLYRCFMEQTWRHGSARGVVGLIHPETHFTDEKAGLLREETYRRLRRHWQFVNELQLFEIHHLVSYGVHAYGSTRQPQFVMATSLYHPDTVTRSLEHDGSGPEPGLKDPDGNWDLRPHRSRITTVTLDTLRTWHELLESPDVPVIRSRMVYAVNRSVAAALDKLSAAGRVGDLDLEFSQGWNETTDRKKGYFESEWGAPTSWDDVILQGPHLFVATPIYKTPNKTMLHNQDWSATDFETLAPDAIPVTAYKLTGDRYAYDCAYTEWGDDDNPLPARDFYRVAWRNMAANTGERTLIPAIIPPGAAHVDGVFSLGAPQRTASELAGIAAFLASLASDFAVRVAPKSTIRAGTARRIAVAMEHPLLPVLVLRALRLNCVVNAYADLWAAAYDRAFSDDEWVGGLDHPRRPLLGGVGPKWARDTPLRIAADRRQALVEIDALVAMMLGLTADELCTIYRTQFAVLYGYDHHTYFYDASGRLVPNIVLKIWRTKGDAITRAERTATNEAGNTYTYELPFVTLDREADMRQAYAAFEQRLAGRKPGPK